jgi:hypothetical protein
VILSNNEPDSGGATGSWKDGIAATALCKRNAGWSLARARFRLPEIRSRPECLRLSARHKVMSADHAISQFMRWLPLLSKLCPRRARQPLRRRREVARPGQRWAADNNDRNSRSSRKPEHALKLVSYLQRAVGPVREPRAAWSQELGLRAREEQLEKRTQVQKPGARTSGIHCPYTEVFRVWAP